MTTGEIREKLNLRVYHAGEEREVTTGFCGDLLSQVMGHAQPGSAWITVMRNVNIAAVAMLCDASCVILAQGVCPDESLLQRVQRENLPLFGTEEDVYTTAVRLGRTL